MRSSSINREPTGTTLHKLYNGKLHELLGQAYGGEAWAKPWLFSSLPRNWWANTTNQRLYLEQIRLDLSLNSSLDDLYQLTSARIIAFPHGKSLLRNYNTVRELLHSIYPNHIWEDWKFQDKSTKQASEQRRDPASLWRFLEEVMKAEGLTTLASLYKLTHRMLSKHKGVYSIPKQQRLPN